MGTDAGKIVETAAKAAGASGNDKLKTAGSLASIGATIGTAIGGPLGTAIGGAVGFVAGLLFGKKKKKEETPQTEGTTTTAPTVSKPDEKVAAPVLDALSGIWNSKGGKIAAIAAPLAALGIWFGAKALKKRKLDAMDPQQNVVGGNNNNYFNQSLYGSPYANPYASQGQFSGAFNPANFGYNSPRAIRPAYGRPVVNPQLAQLRPIQGPNPFRPFA